MKILSQATLKELISYEPTTGSIFWLARPRKYFKSDKSCDRWNKIFAGVKAGTLEKEDSKTRYSRIEILGTKYLTHRIIYLYMTGTFPEQTIDHINGDKKDNRWLNIRAVSYSGNAKNTRLRKDNSSGFTGVSYSKSSTKWVSSIRIDRRTIYLGSFENIHHAIAARMEANEKYGFHPNHGSRK